MKQTLRTLFFVFRTGFVDDLHDVVDRVDGKSVCSLVGEEADLRCVGEDQIEGGVVVLDREELCVALQVFRQLPLLLLNGFDTSPRAAEYVHGRLGDRKTTARGMTFDGPCKISPFKSSIEDPRNFGEVQFHAIQQSAKLHT